MEKKINFDDLKEIGFTDSVTGVEFKIEGIDLCIWVNSFLQVHLDTCCDCNELFHITTMPQIINLKKLLFDS